jgi:hypothetical protein
MKTRPITTWDRVADNVVDAEFTSEDAGPAAGASTGDDEPPM